jgi:hypothetical protein
MLTWADPWEWTPQCMYFLPNHEDNEDFHTTGITFTNNRDVFIDMYTEVHSFNSICTLFFDIFTIISIIIKAAVYYCLWW